jgi:hypothetical protein
VPRTTVSRRLSTSRSPQLNCNRQVKTPPPSAGAKRNKVLSLAARHAASPTPVRIDRNQKSVPVGVGEFVSLYIGAVIERAVHLEAIIVLGPRNS